MVLGTHPSTTKFNANQDKDILNYSESTHSSNVAKVKLNIKLNGVLLKIEKVQPDFWVSLLMKIKHGLITLMTFLKLFQEILECSPSSNTFHL